MKVLSRIPTNPEASTLERVSRWVPIVLAIVLAIAVGAGIAVSPKLGALVLVIAVAPFLLRSWEALLHVLALSVFVESIGFGPLRIGRMLAVVALGAVVFRLLGTRWDPPKLRLETWAPAAVFVAWAAASAFWARDFGEWMFTLGQLGLALTFFAAFALFATDGEQIRRILRTWVLGAVGVGVLGVLQAVGGMRAEGYQGDPNLYALYQVAAVPAAAALARSSTPRYRPLWLAAILPLAASVVASESRGGLVTLAFVVGYLLLRPGDAFFATFRRRVAMLAGIGIVAGVLVFGTAIGERLRPDRVAEDRGSGRFDIWLVAVQSARDNPVLGLGAGSFKIVSFRLLDEQPGVERIHVSQRRGEGVEVHNVYLETAADLGIPGLLAFLAILFVAARTLRTAARRAPPGSALVALPPMFYVFLIATVFLSTVNNKLLWMLVGIGAALDATRRRERAPATMTASGT